MLTVELRDLKKPLEKGTENDLLGSLGNVGLASNVDMHNGDSAEANEVIDAVGSLSVSYCNVCVRMLKLRSFRSVTQPDRINYHGSSANAFVRFLSHMELYAIPFTNILNFHSTS